MNIFSGLFIGIALISIITPVAIDGGSLLCKVLNIKSKNIPMTTNNPYKAPTSNIENRVTTDHSVNLSKTVTGQKLVIYAVLIYFITAFAGPYIGPFTFVLLLPSLIMSLSGLYMVLSQRQSHVAVKILLFILLFVPLINILVLLRVNARATKTLRAAGYKVGLMGARKLAT